MERLRPTKLDVDSNAPDARQTFKHWLHTLEHFLIAAENAKSEKEPPLDKYGLLINYLAPIVYTYVEGVSSYEEGIGILKRAYVRPKNVIFAWHLLSTRHQQSNETLSEFLQALRSLSKECEFAAVSAQEYTEEMIRDAFINCLASPSIRQDLLEQEDPNLQKAYDVTISLSSAQEQANKYVNFEQTSVVVKNVEEILSEKLRNQMLKSQQQLRRWL